jgi:hypothetical protein
MHAKDKCMLYLPQYHNFHNYIEFKLYNSSMTGPKGCDFYFLSVSVTTGNLDMPSNILMSDEAYFHLLSTINMQNFQY